MRTWSTIRRISISSQPIARRKGRCGVRVPFSRSGAAPCLVFLAFRRKFFIDAPVKLSDQHQSQRYGNLLQGFPALGSVGEMLLTRNQIIVDLRFKSVL